MTSQMLRCFTLMVEARTFCFHAKRKIALLLQLLSQHVPPAATLKIPDVRLATALKLQNRKRSITTAMAFTHLDFGYFLSEAVNEVSRISVKMLVTSR
jgi:hypothetical protein